jgi:hypothetical protein
VAKIMPKEERKPELIDKTVGLVTSLFRNETQIISHVKHAN